MNPHAIRDEIVRNRTDLILNLNKLFDHDPESGVLAYQLCIQQIHLYFKGNDENGEPVNEQSGEI